MCDIDRVSATLSPYRTYKSRQTTENTHLSAAHFRTKRSRLIASTAPFFAPLVRSVEPLEAVAAESYPLFIQLRHRAPNCPIYLSEVTRKPFALSRVFLLSSGGKSSVLVKKKAPSRSGFLLSMYVVLKTRHVNPNIHVRRFIVHVRSPNLFATRPQLLSLRGPTTQYRSLHKAI